MSEPLITDNDAAAVMAAFGMLAELGKAIGQDYYVTAHTEEGVRLWHVDGYSPGVFVMDDDFWMFRASYREPA